MSYPPKKIRESKDKALRKIKEYLDSEDVDSQFKDLNGGYYSKDKFLVTWIGNWRGMASEFGIDKCDNFYSAISGNKAIYSTRGLFHEKQLGGYPTIERALIEVGLKICRKSEKKDFFDKYAVRYNEKLKEL